MARICVGVIALLSVCGWALGYQLSRSAWLVAHGWPSIDWQAGLVGMLMLPPLVVSACMSAAIVLSQLARSQRPRPMRIGFGRWLALVGRECSAILRLIWIELPFARWRVPRDTPARSAVHSTARPMPILLIHGYICNGGFWRALWRKLIAQGYGVHTHDLEPVFCGSISQYVAPLHARIEAICAQTNSDQLIIVAHSMGGLATRAYLAKHASDARVAKLITLGTPHHGTASANNGPGYNAKDMQPDSTWLRALAAQEKPTNVPLVCVISYHDTIVFPQLSAQLVSPNWTNQTNEFVHGIGHVEMAFSPVIHQIVLKHL
jgi:pimeloyl-ACP methyl ester carboxylesterase